MPRDRNGRLMTGHRFGRNTSGAPQFDAPCALLPTILMNQLAESQTYLCVLSLFPHPPSIQHFLITNYFQQGRSHTPADHFQQRIRPTLLHSAPLWGAEASPTCHRGLWYRHYSPCLRSSRRCQSPLVPSSTHAQLAVIPLASALLSWCPGFRG